MFVPEMEEQLASRDSRRKLGIRYITQVHSKRPTFVVFLSGRNRLHFSAERYLVNRLREEFGFFATPIRIQQRLRGSKIPKQKDKKQ
jgi:GTP-binding protein